MRLHSPFLLLIFCALYIPALSQDKSPAKFGNVTEKDFQNKIYSIDSNANAVVIADIGTSEIEGNTKGWFSVTSKHYRRVHILNKNGYDAADVSIPLYTNGEDEERLEKIKAVTYNLENGKVVETKLDAKSGVFEDKIDKFWRQKKFTFPNIKEGSIIEFEYTTVSDFINNIDPWEFQGPYPVLWSEYDFTVPAFFYYVFLTQGYRTFDINTHKEGRSTYSVLIPNGTGASDNFKADAAYTEYRWVLKNAPAMKEESFTSTIRNHIQKLDFVLVERKDPLPYYRYVESWPQVAHRLLESEAFGSQLSKDNGWLKDIVKPLIEGAPNNTEKARRIYNYVRDNFSCTDQTSLVLDQTLRSVTKAKKGNVAEINLLLVAMLRYANITANPVILSTRSHGATFAVYPVLSQYNYVVADVMADNNLLLLDASEPRMGFGHLPLRCYNGSGREISEDAQVVDLNSDYIHESEYTSVFLINDEKGNLSGSLQQTPGYYTSNSVRNSIKEKGKDQMLKDIQKEFTSEVEVSNLTVDSLDLPDSHVNLKFDFTINNDKAAILYLNPTLSEGYKENPFKAAERLYPVEMPYTIDKSYTLQMELPEGYVVDELPKSMVVKLNDQGDGVFEYRISQSGNNISFRSRIQLNRTVFQPEEYEMLREFFNLIVKKHAEQIVFKKK